MRHFWNWVKNDDETRTLYLEGVIAEESWFADDVPPAMFKEELFSGDGPITLHINSPGGDCIAASQMIMCRVLTSALSKHSAQESSSSTCDWVSLAVNVIYVYKVK